MRPTPQEVVDRVRALLKDVVAPEVADDHARARLEEARVALAQVDWDDAGFALAARNRAIADALATAGPWRAGAPPQLPTTDTYAEHQAAYERLAAELVAVLARVREHLTAAPGDEAAVAVQQALLRVA